MFFLAYKKILGNKWLMACLLAGTALIVAMVCSIPLYTGGILQRLLVKDLEQYQNDTGNYPGRCVMMLNAYTYYHGDNRIKTFDSFDSQADAQTVGKLGLPYVKVERLGMDYMTFLPEVQKEQTPHKTYAQLYGLTDFEKHIDVTAGRLPAAQSADGVYEVVAAQEAQSRINVLLGETLVLTDETNQMKPIRVKIVGLYKRPAGADAWWSEPDSSYSTSFLMNYNLFLNDFVRVDGAIVSAYWYYALDYTKLKAVDLKPVVDQLNAEKQVIGKFDGATWEFPAEDILTQYAARANQLTLTLWVLQAPILLMLLFYIFMVSMLIVENDRNEIAVLNSRGASRAQIFGSYLIQNVLLAGLTVALGLPLAMVFCSVLGNANGFLEFVSRTKLPLAMNGQTALYALCAGCCSALMMMLPVARASRVTIVEHKQRKARRWNAPLWQKIFLDVLLLGASVYGLFQYNILSGALTAASASGADVPLDPFLFVMSTLFVLGAGLLFLRVYPWLIRILSWAGDKIWPPEAYLSLRQVGRSNGREQFLMLFLVLTISIGVFSANSARTINQNAVDRVNYKTGADITLQMKWPGGPSAGTSAHNLPAGSAAPSQADGSDEPPVYEEPDYNLYSRLDGTATAARVFLPEEQASIRGGGESYVQGTLMAVIPNEFGKVVWSIPDLLPAHINAYLNLLSKSPRAVLVSDQLMKDLNLKVGDPIRYFWGKQRELDGVVYGSVKFWPTLNPYETRSKYFVVANLKYVQAFTLPEPYQIWYKRAPGATTAQIYSDIKAKGMKLLWINNAQDEIVKMKNDALLQGTNGFMTLGFIVTLAISMIGFFIYWLLSMRSRTLQFGILRAMGMKARRVMLILAIEQALISGAAIFVGLIIGGLMSRLFVPLLGMATSAAQLVPPFTVVASPADYSRIYAVIGSMLAAGTALLAALVKKIRATQAIKLGED